MCTIFVTHVRNYIMGATPMTEIKTSMPINVKMTANVGILTFIRMINTRESLKAISLFLAF